MKNYLKLIAFIIFIINTEVTFAHKDKHKDKYKDKEKIVLPQEIGCNRLPSNAQLKTALLNARNQDNGGFDFEVWGTIVNRDGIVCTVAFTGTDRGEQWPGSRVISAQNANTANAFSLPNFALSTANLYKEVQPGGMLFGRQYTNPVDTSAAYAGPSYNYGTVTDPLVGKKIGGINVSGGGLALYDNSGQLIGGLGVSGDSSCADHNIAWRTRNNLNLDYVPQGISDNGRPDNIIYNSEQKWSHPVCSSNVQSISENLPLTK